MGTTVLVRGDIEVSLYSNEEELVEVLLQFTLPRAAPLVAEWEAFARDLCRRWNLAIIDREAGVKGDASHFRRLLEQLPQWQLLLLVPVGQRLQRVFCQSTNKGLVATGLTGGLCFDKV